MQLPALLVDLDIAAAREVGGNNMKPNLPQSFFLYPPVQLLSHRFRPSFAMIKP